MHACWRNSARCASHVTTLIERPPYVRRPLPLGRIAALYSLAPITILYTAMIIILTFRDFSIESPGMETLKIFKALGNEHRLQMLEWLKAPEAHFPPHQEVEGFGDGVCVAFIQQKAGLSQSTTSHYLAILEDAGLVIPTRIGKWTYYKRNEAAIAAFLEAVQKKL
jgi:DNA-binding transcriptional ArsR family regulator